MVRAAGLKTGVYTSPHLEEFSERIVVDGKQIPPSALASLCREVRACCEQLSVVGLGQCIQFEAIRAIAFLYFAREGCDYVSLEVGLGGRYDATNVVTPDVSVITTISYEHTEVLGNTLAEIASEKAGIIKQGVPVVTGVREPEALGVIRHRAANLGCSLCTVGSGQGFDVTWKEKSVSLSGQYIDVMGPGFGYSDLLVPLSGRHQQMNAAVAIACMHEAAHVSAGNLTRLLSEEVLRRGMASVTRPGRFEVLSRSPLIIVDGAHNIEGIEALGDSLTTLLRQKQPAGGSRLLCVYGALVDKSLEQVTAAIAPLCDLMIVTEPLNPRAVRPEDLAQEASRHTRVMVIPDIHTAIDRALGIASADDTILVCGSLYLAGPARTYLMKKVPKPYV